MASMEMGSMGAAGALATTAAPDVGGGSVKVSWYWQIVDLDISWTHGILGFNDFPLIICGLVYGLVIIGFSGFVLQAVYRADRTAAVLSRWYMMFMHLELILYVAVVLMKYAMLCDIIKHFWPKMHEDCRVLRYMFFEMSLFRVILGSLCCWVFSSFAYLLAWGDACIHDATLADDVDQDIRRRGYQFPQAPLSAVAISPQVGFSPPTQGYVEDRRYAPQGTRASFDRVSQVGEPVSVGGSRYEPRWVGASGKSFGAQGAYPGGGSFASQQGRYGGSQYIMPRASSSMQSNNTEASQAERQMLIKPPIVIH